MVYCHFCRSTVLTIEAAIEAEWIPSFYYTGDECETPDPVCPACQETHLELADDGEYVCITD